MSKVQKDRPRLGRGLSTLISPISASVGDEDRAVEVMEKSPPGVVTPPPEAIQESRVGGQPTELPIDDILPNPHQPRKAFGEAGLNELAASLKSTGLIQPIIVRKVGTNYQLIAGERRLRAARIAGLAMIPAIVRDIDGLSQAQMALVENTQREDLNPLDRATAYRILMEQLGLTQNELAGRLGEDRSTIANHLRLLELDEPVQQLIATGGLSLGHAKVLAGVLDFTEQARLARLVLGEGLSVRALERLVAEGSKVSKAASSKPVSAHIDHMEKSMSRQLGMRVQVRSGSKGTGRLMIHYASLDQFDELLSKLGVNLDD